MVKLNSETIEKIYRDKYQKTLPDVSQGDAQLHFLLEAVKLLDTKDISVLDAGCGSGKYSQYLANQRIGKVCAIDLFENVPLFDGVDYRKASIDSIPFPPETFDLVYSFSVLFYLDAPKDGLQEFYRVLKPGGIVLLSAHTKYSLFTLYRVVKRALGLKGMKHLEGVRFYSARQYSKMLKESKFEVLQVDGYNLSFFWMPLYKKLSQVLNRIIGRRLPMPEEPRGKSKLLSWSRSVFGYHSVILAKKVS